MDYTKLSNEELIQIKKEKEKKFSELSYSRFLEYGCQDVGLLVDLDNKLQLLDLAKYIAYTCGVNLGDIHGTMRQWNSFMFNRAFDENLLLPLESQFPDNDNVLLKHISEDVEIAGERANFFRELTMDPELHGQAFAGGWTRGTAKFWKWVFSLDYTSLYPSAIMWSNIGIDTLIEPKNLPKELLDLRAKYFIYYPKNVAPKDFAQFDYEFIRNVLEKPEVIAEINAVLVKYNVSATPNGMFFRKESRAIASQVMEDMITQRKIHKKDMKNLYKEMEKIKGQEYKLLEEEKALMEELALLEA